MKRDRQGAVSSSVSCILRVAAPDSPRQSGIGRRMSSSSARASVTSRSSSAIDSVRPSPDVAARINPSTGASA
jgi:hypothetical protein